MNLEKIEMTKMKVTLKYASISWDVVICFSIAENSTWSWQGVFVLMKLGRTSSRVAGYMLNRNDSLL